jgi:hypothetical protein
LAILKGLACVGESGFFWFFTVFPALYGLLVPRPSADAARSASAVGPALASASPDFLGELLPLGLRGFVDDPPAFIVCASLVGQSRLNILCEVPGSGVELARAPSSACPGRNDSKARVTALAEPSQVLARPVRLVAVNVVDDEIAR